MRRVDEGLDRPRPLSRDGLCEEIAPAVFTPLDGPAYVKEGDQVRSEPGGSAGVAMVSEALEDAVTEAAEERPGSASLSSQVDPRESGPG